MLAALGAFLMHEVTRGSLGAITKTYVNDSISSNAERATILSLQSMWRYAGGAAGLFASGFVAERWSMTSAWTWSGAVLVAAGIFFAVRKRAGP